MVGLLKIKIYAYLIIFFIINDVHANSDYYLYGNKYSSFNLFGETGIIVLPSAQIKQAGSLNFSYSKNEVFKYGALSISPFSWLEANYFYYRPRDLYWDVITPATYGKYLDKGFSVKFGHRVSDRLHFAIGLSDFAGTGFFSREYLLGTYQRDFYRITAGLGFGKFAVREGFSNPFEIISKKFSIRPERSSNYTLGGEPAYDKWFRGDATFLFGGEFFLPGKLKNTTIKIDYDPFDYLNSFTLNRNRPGASKELRKKDSNINLGLLHAFSENVSLGIYFVKGNTLNFTFTFGGNFSKPFFKKNLPDVTSIDSKKGNNPKQSFYEDLIFNINRQNVFLQSSEIESTELKVAVSSSKYRNPIHVHALLGRTVEKINKKHSLEIDTITSIGVNVGHELHKISSPISAFSASNQSGVELVINDSKLQAGDGQNYKKNEFRPTIKYPASFTGMTPSLVNHIGDPAKFYYGGIILRLDNEIQFSSRLQLNTEINQNLINNFDDKRNAPDSALPNVRTDIVSYLQESDTYISRMQLDYFFNPYNEIFGKISGGILENMYAGFGTEFLYKPFHSNLSIGLEAYKVKKRSFNRKFDLLDYETSTGHLNINYYIPDLGILGTLSYGKYLAGDRGYTFDISRRLNSGFRAGIFFSRTNVSPQQFGEGTFDKGFYFQIPIDLFLNDYRGGYINFKLRPLTRDGGQKLEAGNDLLGIMHSSSYMEIYRDWQSFYD